MTNQTSPKETFKNAADQARDLFMQGRYDDALRVAETGLVNGRNAVLLDIAATSSFRLRQSSKAERYWQEALKTQPDFVVAAFNLGNFYLELGKQAEAESAYRYALKLKPDHAEAHNNYGVLLSDMKRLAEAEHHLRRALELQPNHVGAHGNLGILFGGMMDFDRAEQCFRRALQIKPDDANSLGNLGNVCMETERYEEAERFYLQTIAINPDDVRVRRFLSFLCLVTGHFEQGWRLGEFRYDTRMKNPACVAPRVSIPRWSGEDLSDKSLLVCHEQGFGDMIQFVRYVNVLHDRGAASVTVLCKEPLKKLFQSVRGVSRVISYEEQDSLGVHDYWVFMLSLPFFFKTTLETIPAEIPYLAASAEAAEAWRSRIPMEGFRVGLVWKGSTEHKGDTKRSLASLRVLRSLWEIPGVTFVSLQKGQGEDEASQPPDDQPLLNLGSEMTDFGDAAAIIASLDLVITVDTATAHLAGALGKPVWVLISAAPDWRWLLKREDSPWYKTMRLFRQKIRGDWTDVVHRLGVELDALVKGT